MTGDRATASIVDELIHQFTDPFAFYRELIQNSIDAGSTRIEVTLSFNPAAGSKGLCVASVADWGEGMNRDIIESYLVTKFRSTKENDFTKIGKFGIGFVSVFACQPDAVTVDTGRDGESWRVLFRRDTTYELLQPKEPLEGTRVTLHKRMPADEYAEFVTRSFHSVRKWCRHSEVDVVFSAGGPAGTPPPPHEPVREPLAVDAPFHVEHVEEGTHIVAGPSRVSPPVTGLYNRGLTLLETEEALVDDVALKIVSRYLEHTLTRDNVRRDKHFNRAVTLAKQLAAGKLKDALPDELKKAAQRKDGFADWVTLFRYAQSRLPAAKLWFRLCGGGAIGWDELNRSLDRRRELLCAEKSSTLVERMRSAGLPVLELPPGPVLRRVESLLKAKSATSAEERFTYAEPSTTPAPPGFTSALLALLGGAGARVLQVMVCEVRGAAREDAFCLFEAPGHPVRFEAARQSPFTRGAPPLLVLNRAHLSIGAAEPLFTRAPRLAAVLMARLVLVHWSRLDEKADRKLTGWALA